MHSLMSRLVVYTHESDSGASKTANNDDIGASVKAEAMSPSGSIVDVSVKKINGNYTVAFTPTEVGDWFISIKVDHDHIDGSPFRVRVNDADEVKVYGLEQGVVGKVSSFTVDTLRAGEGDVIVEVVTDCRQVPVQLQPEDQEAYRVTFTPPTSGAYTISISFSGRKVQGSPFVLDVTSIPKIKTRCDAPRKEDCDSSSLFIMNAAGSSLPGVDVRGTVINALLGCLNGGTQEVFIARQGLVDCVLELYSDKTIAQKTLSVEFLGELGIDFDGLTRDFFSSFWKQVAEYLFRGEDCLVPDLPLFRVRKEMWKFECLGRILSHTVALTGTIPSIFAKSTLVRFTADDDIDDNCLLEDFYRFVTKRESVLLAKATSDFSALSTSELDRLLSFFTAHGFHDIPRVSKIKEQILAIAHQDLVEKPGSLISKMRHGIPESHEAAFWQRLSADDISLILHTQRPTPEKVAKAIATSKEDLTDVEDRTLYMLKEFVASLDFQTLTNFLIFVTGSIHQPDKIHVTFTTLTGFARRPVSHTCGNQLDIPTSYGSIKELRREFLSILASNEAYVFSNV